MYDRIIVPIEEDGGLDDVAPVRPLARALGCELTLLHVHDPMEAPPELEGLPQYRFQGVVESWDEVDQRVEAEEVEWLSALAAEVAREEEVPVTSRVVHAPLSRRLRSEGESVLVVAPSSDVHLEGLSATVRELLRGGGVPVLIIRPDAPVLPIRRMLVTLDGSEFSEEVVEPALELARATGARVSLLEVVTRRTGLVRMLRPSERSADSAERALRSVRSRIPEDVGPVDVRVVEMGNAPAGIASEARREEVDLVAMATHGRGGIRRLMLGSVAESVVRSSTVPVLLYRPLGVRPPSRSPAPSERAPAEAG